MKKNVYVIMKLEANPFVTNPWGNQNYPKVYEAYTNKKNAEDACKLLKEKTVNEYWVEKVKLK